MCGVTSSQSIMSGRLYCQVRRQNVAFSLIEDLRQTHIREELVNIFQYDVLDMKVDVEIPLARTRTSSLNVLVSEGGKPKALILYSSEDPAGDRIRKEAADLANAFQVAGYEIVFPEYRVTRRRADVGYVRAFFPSAGQPWTAIECLTSSDLKAVQTLRPVLHRMNNIIRMYDGFRPSERYQIVIKLLICKAYTEMASQEGGFLEFFISDSELSEVIENGSSERFADRLARLWENVRNVYSDVFESHEQIGLSKQSLAECVSILQRIRLLSKRVDAISDAFQEFVSSGERAEKGEFITPPIVRELAVRMAKPRHEEFIIDPAAGTAGFIRDALQWIWEELESKYEDEEMLQKVKKSAGSFIHGIEIDRSQAQVAKMAMILIGDGHTNIVRENALFPLKDLKAHGVPIDFEKYQLVFTNPPFGSSAKIASKKVLRQFTCACRISRAGKNEFSISDELAKSGVSPEILFVERVIDFLAPGGWGFIVLPDGLLSNSSDEKYRWVFSRRSDLIASISLPPETFVPYGTGVKSSLIVFRKKDSQNLDNMPIFMAHLTGVGYDASGKVKYKLDAKGNVIQNILDTNLDDILIAWNQFCDYYSFGRLITNEAT